MHKAPNKIAGAARTPYIWNAVSELSTEQNRVVSELVAQGRRAMDEAGWILDSCLPATRVAIKVLAHFGIDATPLVVTVRAMNKLGAEYIDRSRQLGVVAPLPRDAWKVDIGYQLVEGKWAKHVVAIAGNRLIDLTLDQVSRPEKDLIAQPLSTVVRVEFLRGQVPLAVGLDRGGRVQYDALPNDASYAAQRSWMDEATQDKVVEVIVNRVVAGQNPPPPT
jgi:hypothetical protein